MVKRFQRRIENFSCDFCGAEVIGDGYTDHCPVCLLGKHVDIFPGDRLEECHGQLTPITILERKSIQSLEYQCQKCGETMINRVAAADSRQAVLELAKSLAKKVTH
jgi:ribosomal protein L37AE/L43A